MEALLTGVDENTREESRKSATVPARPLVSLSKLTTEMILDFE